MLEGDDPARHEQAAALLADASHVGQPHEVHRAVYSVRGNGDAYLFVACGCGAELGFKLDPDEVASAIPADEAPAAVVEWDPPARSADEVGSAGEL